MKAKTTSFTFFMHTSSHHDTLKCVVLITITCRLWRYCTQTIKQEFMYSVAGLVGSSL